MSSVRLPGRAESSLGTVVTRVQSQGQRKLAAGGSEFSLASSSTIVSHPLWWMSFSVIFSRETPWAVVARFVPEEILLLKD